MECLIMGRDLVRLLQNVARIPEMELIWKDLLHNPQVLSPQFTGDTTLPTILQVVPVLTLVSCASGVLQLLTARTSRKFLACRLTPDMETKLLFMTSRVTIETCPSSQLCDPRPLTRHLCHNALRYALGSRSVIRTGSRDSTCPPPRASRCAVT